MRKFKFEINIEEIDVEGDEFWEDALQKDGSGIEVLTKTINDIFTESNLFISSDKNISEIIKLVKFSCEQDYS